jgi:hypothetical protein
VVEAANCLAPNPLATRLATWCSNHLSTVAGPAHDKARSYGGKWAFCIAFLNFNWSVVVDAVFGAGILTMLLIFVGCVC